MVLRMIDVPWFYPSSSTNRRIESKSNDLNEFGYYLKKHWFELKISVNIGIGPLIYYNENTGILEGYWDYFHADKEYHFFYFSNKGDRLKAVLMLGA